MKPRQYYDLETDFWTPHGGTGTAHSVSGDPPEDIIEQLHAVVEEVTRRPVAPRKPRMGFL